MRVSAATVLLVALALAGAAPAGAVSGGHGVATAVHAGLVVKHATSGPGPAVSKVSTCDANPVRMRRGAKGKQSSTQIWDRMAPVACEQPPRSELLPPDALKHAVAAALAALG